MRVLAASIAASAVAAALLVISHVDLPAVRVPAALLLVLVLPGLAISYACFPEVDSANRAVLVPGLSLITGIATTAALAATPIGLRADWAAGLLAVLVCLCAVAIAVRSRSGPDRDHRAIRLSDAMIAAGALSLAIAAIVVASDAARDNRANRAELSAVLGLGADGHAAVRVRIANDGSRGAVYRLVIRADGRRLRSLDSVEIDAGGSIGIVQSLARVRFPGRLTATLYRPSRPERAYRRVWISLGTGPT